jgi:hypothetical protein
MAIFKSQAKGRVEGYKLTFPNSKRKSGIIVDRDASVLKGMRVGVGVEKHFSFIGAFQSGSEFVGRELIVDGCTNLRMYKDLMEFAEISEETGVIYVGCGDNFEIWQPCEFERFTALAREKGWEKEATKRYL